MKLIITIHDINFIGGIETWIYNLVSQLYTEYDILVLFEKGDVSQLSRINEYVNVRMMQPKHQYQCDVCIFASINTKDYENIKASRFIQMIHADADALNISKIQDRKNKKIEYVSVTKLAKSKLKKKLSLSSTVLENPLQPRREPQRILHLISCTRISQEKGYSRMEILANELKENNIPFEWKIFTDTEFYKQDKLDYPEIIYMKPQLDVVNYIVDSDYGVQLSDTESYGYFIHECLEYYTPIIVTDLPCLKETSFIDGTHGYKINFDMKNLDVKKIYNQIPEFSKEFTEPDAISHWKHFLGEGGTQTIKEDDTKIRANISYYDVYLKRQIKPNEILQVPSFRANVLCNTFDSALKVPFTTYIKE